MQIREKPKLVSIARLNPICIREATETSSTMKWRRLLSGQT